MFVHQPHVGVVLQTGVELVVAVEILQGADPVAHQAAGLTGEGGGSLVNTKHCWILKQQERLITVPTSTLYVATLTLLEDVTVSALLLFGLLVLVVLLVAGLLLVLDSGLECFTSSSSGLSSL